MTRDQAQIDTLMPLISKRFIQRREPVAQQFDGGGYRPLRDMKTKVPTARFDRTTLTEHLSEKKTYGHYLLDQNDMTKLFVLDIDLTVAGFVPARNLNMTDPSDEDYQAWVRSFYCVPKLRDIWHSRRPDNLPARKYIKYQLRMLSNKLAASTYSIFKLRTAVAYTGNKGVHVYGFFDEPKKASLVRDAAELVMESVKHFKPSHGDNFYADERREIIPMTVDDGPEAEYVRRWQTEGPLPTFNPDVYHNFHVEVFPKQRSLEGKDLGNLVRLPLGKNLHAPEDSTYAETFFVDLTLPMTELKPVDPVWALTTPNPWLKQDEA